MSSQVQRFDFSLWKKVLAQKPFDILILSLYNNYLSTGGLGLAASGLGFPRGLGGGGFIIIMALSAVAFFSASGIVAVIAILRPEKHQQLVY